MAGNYLVVDLVVKQILRRKELVVVGIPDVLQSTTSSTPSSSVVQVGILPQFLDQWESITSNRLVLSKMPTCNFLLLSIIVFFCILFGKINPINGRFHHLDSA